MPLKTLKTVLPNVFDFANLSAYATTRKYKKINSMKPKLRYKRSGGCNFYLFAIEFN